MLILSDCGEPDSVPLIEQNVKVAPLAPPKRWLAVLVAGDDSSPVFDNAVTKFGTLLSVSTVSSIHRFTSFSGKAEVDTTGKDVVSGREASTIKNLAVTMASVARQSDTGCFVFITSHGDRRGVSLMVDNDNDQLLTPKRLNDLLNATCGQRPTVAIISACHSGTFLDDAAPNRIILTAARKSRSSFGCEAAPDYTYYDSCLFDQWAVSATFGDLHAAITRCVATKEVEMGQWPSEPQAYFGAAIGNLPLPK
jgi:hypothetical protein